MPLSPTSDEAVARGVVVRHVLEAIRTNVTIRMPLVKVIGGFEGSIGPFRYQFEGEDDLLHLAVTRLDGESLSTKDGQDVASFVLAGVPFALVWMKPGHLSQHFYVGHDDLVGQIDL